MFKKILRTAIVTLVTMGGLSFGADCAKSESLNMVTVESKTFYKIGSCGDLYKFADLVNNTDANINGMLTADIVVNVNLLGTNNANVDEDGSFNVEKYGAEPKPWTPIGNLSMPYTGTFTGKDENGISHTISGLYFNNDERSSVGLFGYVDGGVVKNVGVVDSYFKGKQFVGGVVGYAKTNTTITSVYNTGSVSGEDNCVGGVVGDNFGGTISNAYNTGAVSGANNNVGGVVGDNTNNGTVSNSSNTGAVSGKGSVGGVIGGNGGTVSNSYNSGSVSASGNFVGGVTGNNNNGGTVSNSYNRGSVSGTQTVGGVTGNNNGGIISNSYNTGSVSGSSYVGGVVGYASGAITSVYNTGSISKTTGSEGQYFGSIVGWNNGASLANAYYNTETSSFNAVGAKDGTSSDVEGTASKTTVELAGATLKTLGFDGDVWTAGNATPEVKEGKLIYKLPGLTKLGGQVEFAVFTPNKDGVYEISSAAELKMFAQLVNSGKTDAKGILKADISFNDGSVYDGEGKLKSNLESWTPIGNSSKKYTGTFNGAGKTVSGLYFNNDENNVGFFGYVYGGVVKNVGVVDSYFKGKEYVGGVVGYASGAITDVYNTGSVSGSGRSVGGVVGHVYNATITSVYNTGSVSGDYNVGGVVGYVNDATITTSVYNTGSVSGGRNVGGVVGYVNKATITSAYNTGSISKTTGSKGQYFGSIVGRNNGVSLANAYYNTETSLFKAVGAEDGTSSNVEGTAGKTTAELASAKLTDLGFDGDVWTAGNATPEVKEGKLIYILPGLTKLGGPVKFAVLAPNGNGVYEISSAQQLKWFAQLVNNGKPEAKGILVDDIEFNDGSVYDGEGKLKSNLESWTPIGNSSMPYTGTFDGAGKTVSGLYFNNNEDYVGLFGYVDGGVVKDVGVVDSYFKGLSRVGGVVGYADDATLTGVYNTGSVSGSSEVGGVVGRAFLGELTDVYNTGSISKTTGGEGQYFGGVVGFAGRTTLTNVYNTGSVSGGDCVGGVAGFAYSNTTLTDVYNTGSVSGSSYVGGVAGCTNDETTLTDVYNTGSISKTTGSEGQYFGSIVGGDNGVSLANAYYNTETSLLKAVGAEDGTSSDVEGTAGKTTAQLIAGTSVTLDETAWVVGAKGENAKQDTLFYPYLKVFGSHLYVLGDVKKYTVTVAANDKAMGSVTGAGEYEYGSEVEISATANEGYKFTDWQDDVKDAKRTITVTKNETYTANFEEIPSSSSEIASSSSEAESSSSEVASSSSSSVVPSPAEESSSSKVDSSSSSAKAKSSSSSVKAKSSSSSKAKSSSSKGKEALVAAAQVPQFSVTVSGRMLSVVGIRPNTNVEVFDMQGNCVKMEVVTSANFSFALPSAGTYIIKNGYIAKRVNVR